MSCGPGNCYNAQYLPNCKIHQILSAMYCTLCDSKCYKLQKREKLQCFIQYLSKFSVDPGHGYQFFGDLQSNDPTRVVFVYIDNIRGEYSSNIGAHYIYHVAFVFYIDSQAICRTLRQWSKVIAGNADIQTGGPKTDGAVSLKLFNGLGGILPDGTVPVPPGLTMPIAGFNPGFAGLGGPQDLNFGNPNAIGGFS